MILGEGLKKIISSVSFLLTWHVSNALSHVQLMSAFKTESFKRQFNTDSHMCATSCSAGMFGLLAFRMPKRMLICVLPSRIFECVCVRLTLALIFSIYWYCAINTSYQLLRALWNVGNSQCKIAKICKNEIDLRWFKTSGNTQQKLLVITWSSKEVKSVVF